MDDCILRKFLCVIQPAYYLQAHHIYGMLRVSYCLHAPPQQVLIVAVFVTCRFSIAIDIYHTGEYKIKLDCANIPQYLDNYELSKGLAGLCELGRCQSTCSVDTENFLIDIKNVTS